MSYHKFANLNLNNLSGIVYLAVYFMQRLRLEKLLQQNYLFDKII